MGRKNILTPTSKIAIAGNRFALLGLCTVLGVPGEIAQVIIPS
jgi:hypothetical protein